MEALKREVNESYSVLSSFKFYKFCLIDLSLSENLSSPSQ